MDKRESKYYMTNNYSTNNTRSSRNANLYREVESKYGDLDNLPIEDNTNEIDMEKLRELVSNSTTSREKEQMRENLNILEQKKRQIDEQKVYDINKILEKAKYENSKLKEPIKQVSKPRNDLLKTLGSTELSLEEIEKAKREYQQRNMKKNTYIEESLSITREIKYKDLIEEKDTNTNSSFDLFDDLKGTENTITTKPITSDIDVKEITNNIPSDIHSGDTRDIDIIKDTPTTSSDDFFTNVYEFSKKDFQENDDDFFDEPKKGGCLKIILLVLSIFMFVGVIIYFISKYGQGIY